MEALTAYEPQALPANIRFEVDWPQNIPPVPVDAEGIYQVFSNLIKNSLQAMQACGGVVRISAALEPEHLLIRFEDTGPGIDEQNLSRIFEAFFTTKGKQGTGLGLAIVKSIIEAHRGTVSCRSRTSAGAEFVLRLPLR
jgi:signal transduction histidine kinase